MGVGAEWGVGCKEWGRGWGGRSSLRLNIPRSALCATLDGYDP